MEGNGGGRERRRGEGRAGGGRSDGKRDREGIVRCRSEEGRKRGRVMDRGVNSSNTG